MELITTLSLVTVVNGEHLGHLGARLVAMFERHLPPAAARSDCLG
jgi:hypothetical protein